MKAKIFFEEDQNSILRRAYGEMSLRQGQRNNALRFEAYSFHRSTGGYSRHNTNGMECPAEALPKSVIRYIDHNIDRTHIEASCNVIGLDEIRIGVWRPDINLTMEELTACALGDVKEGHVVVMSNDLDDDKLQRIAKYLKPGVHCYIMDMSTEKIEEILRVVDLGVVIFLDENIRMDASKCERVVQKFQHKISERTRRNEYAEDLTLEELFDGISLQDLATKAADDIDQTGWKRMREGEDEPPCAARQRTGMSSLW